MGIVQKVQEYNQLVNRKNKGMKYLDDPQIPNETKDKFADAFRNIVDRLLVLQEELRELGFEITCNDFLYGIGSDDKDEH
jgi:hypothetical protein